MIYELKEKGEASIKPQERTRFKIRAIEPVILLRNHYELQAASGFVGSVLVVAKTLQSFFHLLPSCPFCWCLRLLRSFLAITAADSPIVPANRMPRLAVRTVGCGEVRSALPPTPTPTIATPVIAPHANSAITLMSNTSEKKFSIIIMIMMDEMLKFPFVQHVMKIYLFLI